MGEEENKTGEKSNIYLIELHKFLGKEVTVVNVKGEAYIGILKAINFQYLNVILMTDKEKIAIRDVSTIRRERTFDRFVEKGVKSK